MSMALRRRAGLVTSRSSPTNCRRSPRRRVISAQSSQPSSLNGSSMETIGYSLMRFSTIAEASGDGSPVFPAFLVERVLDGDDRVLVDEVLVVVEHVGGVTLFTVEAVLAGLLVVELGGGDIQADADLLARLVAGGGDGVHDVLEGVLVGLHLRGEAAFVAEAGVQAFLLQDVLEGVVDLDAGAQGLAVGVEAVRGDHVLLDQGVVDLNASAQSLGVGVEAVRGDHVLLNVGGEVSVSATVHDVHVRDRQDVAGCRWRSRRGRRRS
ncbi:putative uncharacterized protein [Bifidobacterium bifidum CAG:234]|nr:putative uncharacterized protein [Bifidobacterium bifidum CAG:234]